MKIAVADTCFLLNWARFHQREDILEKFDKIVVPEPVLDEIKDIEAKRLVASR